MEKQELKKYIIEALGTMLLSLVVILSLAGNMPLVAPVLCVLMFVLLVYLFGNVLISYFNPAITIALWTVKKLSHKQAISYIVSQFFGSAIAIIIATICKIEFVKLPLENTSVLVGFAELFGAFVFALAIYSIINNKFSKDFAPIIVGIAYLTGIALSILLGANGIINPAIAFAVKSFGVMYILGPIVGAVAGIWANKYLID